MRTRKQNLLVISVIIVISMPLVIMPLSSPVLSNVVVRMSDDVSTEQAISTLECNTQGLMVVDYGSLEYFLLINRVAGIVVWVSHGSDQGILVDNNVMSWERFSQDIRMTPSKDVVLACDSSKLESYLSPSEAFLFEAAVEATLGALVVSFILNGAIAMLSLIAALASLALGVIQIHFLALTTLEFAWDTITFVISLMLLGAGLFITEGLVMAILHLQSVLFIDTAFIVAEVLSGELTYLDLIIPLISLMLGIAGALIILFPASAALIALDTAVLSTPYGWFMIAVNIGVYISILTADWLD
jgi:hypothetical protein